MTRATTYRAEFVESFPTPLQTGVLYVSPTYATACHLCACGCGQEVVTKLAPTRWKLIFDGEASLRPSIGNSGIACNSHYFITRGAVEWSYKLTPGQITKARIADRDAVRDAQTSEPKLVARTWRRITALCKKT